MAIWSEDDTFGRWLQGIAAFFLLLFALTDLYMILHGFFGFIFIVGAILLLCGALRYCWRCSLYTLTGKRDINRDDLNSGNFT